MAVLITTVIPVFNAAALLPRAVASILQQEVPCEIIIINDASTDETMAVAERLAREMPNVHVFRRPTNEGPGRARNAGLRKARGKYVCFLDADDCYSAGLFERAISELDSRPELHAVQFHVRLIECDRAVGQTQMEALENSLPSNVIVRTQFALKLGGFPTGPKFRGRYGGEDLAFRTALHRWGRLGWIEGVYLDYTVQTGSHFHHCLDRAAGIGRIDFMAESILSKALDEHIKWVQRRMLERWR